MRHNAKGFHFVGGIFNDRKRNVSARRLGWTMRDQQLPTTMRAANDLARERAIVQNAFAAVWTEHRTTLRGCQGFAPLCPTRPAAAGSGRRLGYRGLRRRGLNHASPSLCAYPTNASMVSDPRRHEAIKRCAPSINSYAPVLPVFFWSIRIIIASSPCGNGSVSGNSAYLCAKREANSRRFPETASMSGRIDGEIPQV